MSDREWITDRLPTAADADEDGDVTVQNQPNAEPSGDPYFNWELVVPGMAWCHSDIWEAPAKPALAVGQRWRTRDGQLVTIDRYDNDHPYGATHPFWSKGISYTADGIYSPTGIAGSHLDLVELIEPAAEPAPVTTPRRFLSISRTASMDKGGNQYHTIDAVADDGTAWWMVPSKTEWQQLPALPAREVPRF